MNRNLRRALVATGGAVVLIAGAVAAHGLSLAGDLAQGGGQPASVDDLATDRGFLIDREADSLSRVLLAARLGDAIRMRSAMADISDPLARKIALWALIDVSPDGMSYLELERARQDLAGWPHPLRRAAAVEKVIGGGGVSPQGVIAWFNGAQPQTAEGAMALASAYQATGQSAQAADLIHSFWRTKSFDAENQQLILARFGSLLTADDHAAREDMLLFGSQGAAARDLLPFLPPDQQALAEARMALRSGAANADALVAALPPSVRSAPGLAFEQALRFQHSGDTASALAVLPSLPSGLADPDAQARMWKLRLPLVFAALRAVDYHGAYRAAADSGVTAGQDGAEAEFFAGWLALSKLRDPKRADDHFAKLQAIGGSPITQARALYWRGRAAEAVGDSMNAELFYSGAARFQTTFYGQLAATKIGQTRLTLGSDPLIPAADRTSFEARDTIRAARLLAQIGATDTFKSFVAGLAEGVTSAEEAALLVDFAHGYGDQELSMRVVRTAAQHGFILPERGYPTRLASGYGAETAFVLGITRQESGFDPHVRSQAGALGMMQLMPGTAQGLARKLGYSYDIGRLREPDYNMQLGSAYLGQLVDRFGGSYLMAAAAYNAGPGRPLEWASFCGDPRSSSTDPADFIECIPFSETRNYVMRVLEATEVYRARLAGGSAPLSLMSDLKRGGYGGGYAPTSSSFSAAGPGSEPQP